MRGPDDQALSVLDTWLELAPFDQRAHECLFKALARRGKIREAEAHLATTIDLFEREGLESTSIRTAWRCSARRRALRFRSPTNQAPTPLVVVAPPLRSCRSSTAHRPCKLGVALPTPSRMT